MKIIGLTGGIATGKSSVSRHLRSLGLPVIDCDALAREVVEPGTPALRSIAATFGPDVINPSSGCLDRAKLGAIIFADAAKRRQLNAITHPAIRRAILARVIECWLRGEHIVIIDAPLLIESGLHKFMSEVVVVYCPDDIQLKRLMLRDGLDEAAARARMAAQAPMSAKLSLATRVLDNSGSLEELFRQVDELVPRLYPAFLRVWAWRLLPPAAVLGLVYLAAVAILPRVW
ncbi:Dephospho-CoA kinase cab5 [Blastocladiella emersonii ATCC 22665]|nr:Dephospho-CoA kinase cab5 [Blastocladiella emersonii ATCC 22665]